MTVVAHICPNNPNPNKYAIVYYDYLEQWCREDFEGNTEIINHCPFCGAKLDE